MHLVVAAGFDGNAQDNGRDLHTNRAVLAWSHVTWRGANWTRRQTGEKTITM